VNEVEAFDPLTRAWRSLPPLPEPRSSHDAVVVGDELYVVGGWELQGESKQWGETAWVMDLSARELSWPEAPAPPFRRRALAAAAARGKLFAMGGIEVEGTTSAAVDVLDLATGAWSEGPPLPTVGFGMAALGDGNEIYASPMDGKLHRLDWEEMSWKPVSELFLPRIFHRLATAGGGELLAFGGAGTGGHLRDVEILSLDASAPRPVTVRKWTLPNPGAARNRQGAFLHEDALYVFGGNRSLGQHDFEKENFLDEAFRIDLGAMRVEPLPPVPEARQSWMTAVLARERKATAYAFGGFGHDGDVARSFRGGVAFDFENKTWTPLEISLPAPRTQAGLAEHDGRVWIFGGLDFDPRREAEAFAHVTDIDVWDPAKNEGFVPSGYRLTNTRRAFQGAVLDGRYYVVGGMRENFELIEECQVFEFATGAWSSMPAPARARLSGEMVAIGGKLYLAGGSSPGDSDLEPNQSVEVFDPPAGKWSVLLEELPISVRHMQTFVWNGRLLFYSANFELPEAIRLVLVDPGDGGAASLVTSN
jgi:N-acetylneuraminic acid mutarotase